MAPKIDRQLEADRKKENMTMKSHAKTVGTQATIKKVKSQILKENLPTQRFIALKLGMSSDSVNTNK
ncbi:hypothetical protein TNCV_3589451 [Trichonephila clavipes]|nr:hypothetical protein TNCV_3589451 [Trichonephila clavipes]